jgi:hypothetical protein
VPLTVQHDGPPREVGLSRLRGRHGACPHRYPTATEACYLHATKSGLIVLAIGHLASCHLCCFGAVAGQEAPSLDRNKLSDAQIGGKPEQMMDRTSTPHNHIWF